MQARENLAVHQKRRDDILVDAKCQSVSRQKGARTTTAIVLASTGKAAKMQTYTFGDTIRIEIRLRDKTGIGYVAALFNGCITGTRPSGGTIVLVGDGGNRTEANIELTSQITNQTIPGEYRCEYIQVQDTLGNHILHYPDIRFRIEDVPGDHEGPELVDWRFVD